MIRADSGSDDDFDSKLAQLKKGGGTKKEKTPYEQLQENKQAAASGAEPGRQPGVPLCSALEELIACRADCSASTARWLPGV